MPKVKPGDLIWVKYPRRTYERKIGTVMRTKRTKQGIKYVVEWEPVVVDLPNLRAEYPSNEIAKASGIPIRL